MSPNANIFQPGPAFIYVTINGIPSKGSYVIVGSGKIETQTMNSVDTLPPSVRVDTASGTGSSNNNTSTNPGHNSASSLLGGAIGGFVAAAIAVLAILGTIFDFFTLQRWRVAIQRHPSATLPRGPSVGVAEVAKPPRQRDSDSDFLPPLQRSDIYIIQRGQSRDNLMSPSPYLSGASSGEFDPYDLRSSHTTPIQHGFHPQHRAQQKGQHQRLSKYQSVSRTVIVSPRCGPLTNRSGIRQIITRE